MLFEKDFEENLYVEIWWFVICWRRQLMTRTSGYQEDQKWLAGSANGGWIAEIDHDINRISRSIFSISAKIRSKFYASLRRRR